jgi:hypothetical protein
MIRTRASSLIAVRVGQVSLTETARIDRAVPANVRADMIFNCSGVVRLALDPALTDVHATIHNGVRDALRGRL